MYPTYAYQTLKTRPHTLTHIPRTFRYTATRCKLYRTAIYQFFLSCVNPCFTPFHRPTSFLEVHETGWLPRRKQDHIIGTPPHVANLVVLCHVLHFMLLCRAPCHAMPHLGPVALKTALFLYSARRVTPVSSFSASSSRQDPIRTFASSNLL